MANFNKVILAGNLTRDPELRYTPKGTAVAASPWRQPHLEKRERRKQGRGQFRGRGRLGTPGGSHFPIHEKRPPLLVEAASSRTRGRQNTKQKQSKLKVVLESFSFIDSNRGDSGGGGSAEAPRSRPAPQQQARPHRRRRSRRSPEGDDVPF